MTVGESLLDLAIQAGVLAFACAWAFMLPVFALQAIFPQHRATLERALQTYGRDWFKLAAIALLLGALREWPYDYYTLLRFVVCGVAARDAYFAYQSAETASTPELQVRQQRRAWGFGLMAALFNPFIPVHLDRDTWVVLDVGAAVAICADAVNEFRSETEPGPTVSDQPLKRKETQTG